LSRLRNGYDQQHRPPHTPARFERISQVISIITWGSILIYHTKHTIDYDDDDDDNDSEMLPASRGTSPIASSHTGDTEVAFEVLDSDDDSVTFEEPENEVAELGKLKGSI
jgi:hypothetical protein